MKKNQYKNYDESKLKQVHLYLNQVYYKSIFGVNEKDQINNKDFLKFKYIEAEWIDGEKRAVLSQYDCNHHVKNELAAQEALKKHPIFNHAIFDYLMNEANLNDLKKFVISESVLNLEFFDYLALAIIGVGDQAKSEIAANLWDEAGRGKIDKFHTVLFENFMNDLGLKYNRDDVISNMSWSGIAGINLFSYFSVYPFNKMKYFGMLAATEMLDPAHYNKLINGINRILIKNKIDHSYYTEHEQIDVEHASGWLNNVVIPELSKNPEKTQDFWLGFYMRLNSAKCYYDDLFCLLTIKKAA